MKKMTKFNPENKSVLTYGECLHPAMKITDEDDAKQYFEAYLAFQKENMKDATGQYTAEQICKINLGYFAGYYDNETQQRVNRLFCTTHLIFGSSEPTPEEAFECGKSGKTLSEIRSK